MMKAASWRRGSSEHDLQKQVLAYISLKGNHVFVFAVPNAAKRSPATAARMRAEGLMPGVADLCVMLPAGQVRWLELKAARGRQSPEQEMFEEVCEVLGHSYAIARNLDEAIAILKSWGALK
jgi:hypothetical protein